MSDVDSGYRERLTIEELAIDCLDVRENSSSRLSEGPSPCVADAGGGLHRVNLKWTLAQYDWLSNSKCNC